MKTTSGLTIVVALMAGWFALPDPVRADDDAAREIAVLTAENKRLNAEIEHLREAYDQASANLTRATTAVTALQSSLNAADELIRALRAGGEGEERLVDKLKDDIQAWHRYYRDLLVSIGKPAVKPLLALLKQDPVEGMPWIARLFARIGPDAAEAIPYLEQIAADETYQRRGVARYADIALAKIRPPK